MVGSGEGAVPLYIMARPPGAPPAPPSGLDLEAAAEALAGEAQHLADTAGKQLRDEAAEGGARAEP